MDLADAGEVEEVAAAHEEAGAEVAHENEDKKSDST